MTLFLSCARATDLLSDHAEHRLPAIQVVRVRLHLARCGACRQRLATLQAVPRLTREFLALDPLPAPPQAQAALRQALARLGEPPRPEVADGVTEGPSRLLDLARRTLASVLPRETHPVLPEEVAQALPPPDTWSWRCRHRIRSAEVLRDPGTGARLVLLFAEPGVRFPRHRHLGTETLLLLDGELSEGGRTFATGDLLHLAEGSTHAPVIGDEGCWCLVRQCGTQQHLGPLGWLRDWLAA